MEPESAALERELPVHLVYITWDKAKSLKSRLKPHYLSAIGVDQSNMSARNFGGIVCNTIGTHHPLLRICSLSGGNQFNLHRRSLTGMNFLSANSPETFFLDKEPQLNRAPKKCLTPWDPLNSKNGPQYTCYNCRDRRAVVWGGALEDGWFLLGFRNYRLGLFGGGWMRRWGTLRDFRWDSNRVGSLGYARRLWGGDFRLALPFGGRELNFNLLGEPGFGILNLCSNREMGRMGWRRWWLGDRARTELRVF